MYVSIFVSKSCVLLCMFMVCVCGMISLNTKDDKTPTLYSQPPHTLCASSSIITNPNIQLAELSEIESVNKTERERNGECGTACVIIMISLVLVSTPSRLPPFKCYWIKYEIIIIKHVIVKGLCIYKPKFSAIGPTIKPDR